MSPVHIPPHRTVRVVLIKQMINTILIYHSIRIIHPSISWCKVINRTEFFTIGSIIFIRKFHFFPAYSRIRDKLKIERKMFVIKSGKVNWYKVIYFIYSQTDIHVTHYVVIGYHIQFSFGRSLFYRKKQILFLFFYLDNTLSVT